jgi:hypothetical protein
LNGTDRHARSIFTIQINSCQDGTKRVETTNNKFQVRCLQALSARSVAAKRSIWFGRLRASLCATPNVGMIVGSERRNADHIMISMGLGGCRPSQAVGSLTRQRSGASATAKCAIAAPPAKISIYLPADISCLFRVRHESWVGGSTRLSPVELVEVLGSRPSCRC